MWSGEERRKNICNQSCHDKLIETANLLSIHVVNFDKHITIFEKYIDKNDKKMDSLYRFMYLSMGVIITINWVFKFIK